MAGWSHAWAPQQPAGGTWAVLFSEAMSLPGSVSSFPGSGDGSRAESCSVGGALSRPELAKRLFPVT